jgi:hypothetical protein
MAMDRARVDEAFNNLQGRFVSVIHYYCGELMPRTSSPAWRAFQFEPRRV